MTVKNTKYPPARVPIVATVAVAVLLVELSYLNIRKMHHSCEIENFASKVS